MMMMFNCECVLQDLALMCGKVWSNLYHQTKRLMNKGTLFPFYWPPIHDDISCNFLIIEDDDHEMRWCGSMHACEDISLYIDVP